MSVGELCRLTAREAVGLLKSGDLSPLELIDAAARRIDATDGALNALPTLCLERARDHARRLMESATGRDSLLVALAGHGRQDCDQKGDDDQGAKRAHPSKHAHVGTPLC